MNRQGATLIIAATLLFLISALLLGRRVDPEPAQTAQAPTVEPESLTSEPTPETTEAIQPPEQVAGTTAPTNEGVLVTKVIDGDTIALANGQVVRYIGIDTPETKHPTKGVQCFGREAAAQNNSLVAGQLVRLAKDVSETDRYGRTLRYVYVGDLFVNDYLVRQGYAHSYSYPPDIAHQQEFVQAEREARENKRGLWAACGSSTPVSNTGSTKESPSPKPDTSIKPDNLPADCESNKYDCGSFATQAEAQAVLDACGGAANDVHQLDKDGDGTACESLP